MVLIVGPHALGEEGRTAQGVTMVSSLGREMSFSGTVKSFVKFSLEAPHGGPVPCEIRWEVLLLEVVAQLSWKSRRLAPASPSHRLVQ